MLMEETILSIAFDEPLVTKTIVSSNPFTSMYWQLKSFRMICWWRCKLQLNAAIHGIANCWIHWVHTSFFLCTGKWVDVDYGWSLTIGRSKSQQGGVKKTQCKNGSTSIMVGPIGTKIPIINSEFINFLRALFYIVCDITAQPFGSHYLFYIPSDATCHGGQS